MTTKDTKKLHRLQNDYKDSQKDYKELQNNYKET